MADRGPDWYFKATNELLLNKDNEDTRAVLEEARADLRNGQDPKVVVGVLKARGARNNAQGVVNRALVLEMPDIMRTASDDLGAGRTEGPAMARARDVARNLLLEDPSGANLVAKLKTAGASDALAAHLAADRRLKKAGREQAWLSLCAGVVMAIGAIWFYTSTPPGDLPYGSGIFAAAAALLVWYGIAGLNRK